MKLFDIIHPDFQEHCRQIFYRLMSGEQLEQVKTAFITKDGQPIYLEGNINCKFVSGKPVATRSIFRKITQQVIAEKTLHQQQEQSHNTLLSISGNLQQPADSTTENFTDVTVLFADIVGFNESATAISAIQLVNLVNPIMTVFDRLSDRYGLEKIETITDAYMVVGQGSNCTQALAHMALDMQTAIATFNAENDQNFHISIIIHSDIVATEVISLKNFMDVYWGDIANTARCVELSGVLGKIQVTEAPTKYLRDEFLLEKSREIEIKNKGKITTYILLARK